MQIRIVFDDSEVYAIVEKMNHRQYNKKKIADAGKRIIKAYEEFEKMKGTSKISKDQLTLDNILKTMGNHIVE